jgi:hypothetical protein
MQVIWTCNLRRSPGSGSAAQVLRSGENLPDLLAALLQAGLNRAAKNMTSSGQVLF